MIIHSPIISGSLTFSEGSTFTLPDGGIYSGSFSGSLQVHEVSSHIVPDANITYDLGSPTNRFRDIYLSNNSINFPGGSIGINSDGAFTLGDNSGNPAPVIASEIKIVDPSNGNIIIVQVQNGQLVTTATDSGGTPIDAPASDLSGSFSGSFLGEIVATNGVVSGSSQVIELLPTGVVSGSSQVEFNNVNNTPFSQSASSVTTSKSILPTSATIDLGSVTSPFRDLYLSSASLYIDGQQVISSDSSELTITTDVNQSLKLVETSADTITLQTENGDISLVSTGTGNIELNATVQVLAGKQIISSDGNAIQFGEDIAIGGDITLTGNVDGVDVAGLKSDFDTLNGKTLVSGSSQVTPLLPTGVVSGSSQVTPLLPTGVVSGSSQVTYSDISSIPSGIVSSSSQVNADSITNFDTNVLDYNNSLGVLSGSVQILNLVSIDEDTMSSNSDTKLPTQQSVKAYVDSKVAAVVDSAPGALDTLNELAAALGDDANFSTTLSNQIAGKVSQSLQIISGNGLTGGGNLTTDRTLNVVGTADRISVSADAVDIAATYVGQSSITTLGTITTGTWNGTAIANGYLANSTISGVSLGSNLNTLTIGTGLSGTSYNGSGAVTIANTGVLSNIAGTGVSVSGATGNVTISIGQSVGTGDTVQFAKVGVGGASDATYELKVTGDIGATGDIVAYVSSDKRLKDNIKNIENPIEKVQALNGVTWEWNDLASEAAKQSPNVGVIAQEVEEVLPQLVHDRESGFKGVDYSKLTGLLIEAIKEQQKQIDELKSRLQ